MLRARTLILAVFLLGLSLNFASAQTPASSQPSTPLGDYLRLQQQIQQAQAQQQQLQQQLLRQPQLLQDPKLRSQIQQQQYLLQRRLLILQGAAGPTMLSPPPPPLPTIARSIRSNG